MARDKNGEHPRTSNVQRFERPSAPKLTKENMFDFVVKGAQQNYAKQNNAQQDQK